VLSTIPLNFTHPSIPSSFPLNSGREERRALEEKYEALYSPIYDKRSDVINGKAEAPENETGALAGV